MDTDHGVIQESMLLNGTFEEMPTRVGVVVGVTWPGLLWFCMVVDIL